MLALYTAQNVDKNHFLINATTLIGRIVYYHNLNEKLFVPRFGETDQIKQLESYLETMKYLEAMNVLDQILLLFKTSDTKELDEFFYLFELFTDLARLVIF